MTPAIQTLRDRDSFVNLPPNPQPFFETVWLICRQVPAGRVTTYGQIASMIPAPEDVEENDYERLGAVWVGKAMNAVSGDPATTIPWQRVINSQGGISLPEGSRAALEQRRRLVAEGILFGKSDRVDLNAHGWEGPPAAWLRERGLKAPRPLRKPDAPPGQMRLF